ncbi:MAG: DUF2892 domain-containing protein [Hyphomicrobiales bacterium]
MTKNVGTIDRAVRVVLALALLYWAIAGTGSWHWLGWFGVPVMFSALAGWCGAYTLFGINTCAVKRA